MSEWISVKERLPLNDEYVFVHSPGACPSCRVAFYSTHSQRWVMTSDKEITHWMLIPEVPNDNV